jgi:hypothetical protein
MEAEVKELNRFLVSFDLDGAGFSGFRRMFHEGDIKGFDFQWGGRLYGVGDFNYQGIRKAERPNLLINGEAISEIDINASYLSILHGISGYPLPDREDIYDIGGGRPNNRKDMGGFDNRSSHLSYALAQECNSGVEGRWY